MDKYSYILMKDTLGEKAIRNWKRMATFGRGGIIRSHVMVLRGELFTVIPDTELQKKYERPAHNFRLKKDSKVTIYCGEGDTCVAPLSGEEIELLEAIQSPSARFTVFSEEGKLEWGGKLKEGDQVYVSIPGRTIMPDWSIAVVQYVGEVESLPGRNFGVEIKDPRYRGLGSTDGLFQTYQYFLCGKDSGLFVSLDKLSSNPPDPILLNPQVHLPLYVTKPPFVPVLPENWEMITGKETNERFYRNTETKEEIDSPPCGYPLMQNPSYPDVTFFDEPQEKALSSSGGHVDFDNGVEITVPPRAVPLGATVSVKVQPSFAPKDVFVMPQGIHSAGPSYLITTRSDAELDRDVTLTLEHHVNVSTDDDANDLLFLQADTTPQSSDSASVYEYKEVPEARTEFLPGESRGRLTTRRFSFKFFKIGLRKRVKKWFTGSRSSGSSNSDDPPEPATPETPSPDPNRYTVRVYRASPQTSSDRVAIVGVSLYGRLYAKFLKTLDTVIIPRDYPAISSEAVDRTTLGPLSFTELQARLTVVSPRGWVVDPDRETISKSEVDSPETDNFRPEELHDYPPKLVCRFYPEDHTPPRTTCTLSFTGFCEEVKFHIPLKAPKVQRQVDTRILQEAAEKLRTTTIQVKETRLVPTVETILSLMELINTALCSSSSLGVLVAHTDSIKVEVQSVIDVSRKVAEECPILTIKGDIEASLSMVEALSHQLCLVTKVKLKHCQDQFEEAVALGDLVSNGANLMNTVDCLLHYIRTLNEVASNSIEYNVLIQCGEKVVGGFTKDPKTLAVQLLAKKFISADMLEETNELNETNRTKARRLYTAVLGIVRHHPHRYVELISVLKDNMILYRDLLRELEMTYDKL